MSCGLPKFLDPDTGEPKRWREGDTLEEIEFVLPDGQLVADFTITLRVKRPDGTTLIRSAVDLGGSHGKFTWATDSLQAGKNQRAEIHRIDGSLDEFTWPAFTIDVDPRVGP
jgi:hypothetical protein